MEKPIGKQVACFNCRFVKGGKGELVGCRLVGFGKSEVALLSPRVGIGRSDKVMKGDSLKVKGTFPIAYTSQGL
jgi:hypothetical protein